jgi:hypothetical protein
LTKEVERMNDIDVEREPEHEAVDGRTVAATTGL